MVKLVLLAGLVLAACIADVTSDGLPLILPTYRPSPNRGPIIRSARDVNDEPLWLWKGDNIDRVPTNHDHLVLPSVMDDIRMDPNRRYARSLDSPSSKRYGGGCSSSGGSRDTGPTHPGSNRRNARSLMIPDLDPMRPSIPKPFDPISPFNPKTRRGPHPIYARTVRDIQFPGIKKPSHRDIIIPNWNPHIRTNPWDSLGGGRKIRSIEEPEPDV